MFKSFSYDSTKHTFIISRHQVGDFGLHLSLTRSFSWGQNVSVESPYSPGKPLPYHWGFDFLVGILERMGVRIDIALNGLSIFLYTLLLWEIYRLSQIIFGKGRWLGIISVIFFVCSSNLSFLEFIRIHPLSLSTFGELWRIPDYIYQGPFDGSIITLFFTQNVFLNQRHLVAALAISLVVFQWFLGHLLKKGKISISTLILMGLLYGVTSRLHSLVFVSTMLVLFGLGVLFEKMRIVWLFFIGTFVVSAPHMVQILAQRPMVGESLFHLGFLTQQPVSISRLVAFWHENLGMKLFLIPLGVLFATRKQRKIFAAFFLLFLIGNTVRLSFRIEHNHSVFNYFFIVGNMFAALALIVMWHRSALGKTIAVVLFVLTIASGVIDLMVIKNDFHYPVADAPTNRFMQWIKVSTPPRAIFLARQDTYDPITLAGRRNYYGTNYYLEVMGYDTAEKKRRAKEFFEVRSDAVLRTMRAEGISYLVIPGGPVNDFPYSIDRKFLESRLITSYKDTDVTVYRL